MKPKKEYIRDNGKIRHCDSNVAKMNVFEYWWNVDRTDLGKDILKGLREGIKMFGEGFLLLLQSILAIPLYPVFEIIRAFIAIRRSKKEVEKYKK